MSITNHWRRWFSPGVVLLLGVMAGCYLAAMVGQVTSAFDLYRWLALDARRFWSGEVWTVVTYFLLPAGFPDFILNAFFIAWLGGLLGKVWRRNDFLLYCLVAVVGTGLAKAVLTPSSPWLLAGSSGLVFGLLAAIWKLIGHERVIFLGFGEMTMRTAVWIIGGVNIVVALPCAGWVNTLIMLSGAVTGWIYISHSFPNSPFNGEPGGSR